MFTKIIATDMDGTFLRPDGTYDQERLAKLLPQLTDAGYRFVAASGRSLLTLKTLFKDFETQMAFIAENGCIVEDEGNLIFEAQMATADYLAIVAELENNPDCKGYLLSGENGAYVPQSSTPDYLKSARHYYANVQVVDIKRVADKILKVSTKFQYDKAHAFTRQLNQKLTGFQAVVTGFDGIDIIPRAYDKATGLDSLCEQYGIPAKNVLAFGDNYNDLEMLAYAGRAIVPANGVDKAKAIADELIADNSQESVLDYLEGLVAACQESD